MLGPSSEVYACWVLAFRIHRYRDPGGRSAHVAGSRGDAGAGHSRHTGGTRCV